MRMKRAVISGATGVIGTALIQELVESGVEVLALCREGSQRNTNIPEHPQVCKMYCDLAQISGLQNTTGKAWDIFYHFAWMGTVRNSRNDMYLQTRNIQYALDAVAAARRFGCHTFIGAGSQAEYGRVESALNGDTPVFPETGYGITKLCAGQMTREYAHQLGMRQIWVRVLSVYGLCGDAWDMVTSTIETLKRKEVPQFTKGEQIWDYLYSKDAARAFQLLGEKGKDGKVYVLGSGNARPLADYIREIRDIVSPNAAIALGVLPYSEKQVMYLRADIQELQRDVGWMPEFSFREGIKHMIHAQKCRRTQIRSGGGGIDNLLYCLFSTAPQSERCAV